MGMTAAQAAEAVGMTRQGIIKAIKTGKLSAEKDGNGAWRVAASELFRVYPAVNGNSGKVEGGIQGGLQAAHAEIEHLRALVERADRRADEQAARAEEWKSKAEQEGQERRQLMALLTDQRVQDGRRSIWAKLLGK